MNAVDVVQEIVEITVASGDAKGVWPIRKKGVARTEATKKEAGGSRRLSDTCGRRCELGICSGRQEVQHEVLGR